MCLFATQHLYHEESKIVWNGNSIKGRQNVERFLTDLPASKHEPCSLDCQPVKPQGSCLSFLLAFSARLRAFVMSKAVICVPLVARTFSQHLFSVQAFVHTMQYAAKPRTRTQLW